MTYLEATNQLGATRRFGMKLGLDPMRLLASRLGDPQERLRFIHLAGTNGKGSTAAFCESCLRAGGARVGLYTSPHLVSVRERIQIDRVPIPESDFARGMEAVLAAAEGEPTFFELITGLALWHFAREKVEWIVWETGLGGRLDATNIVRPETSVITNIGLDHTQYLGTTLGEIAREKAGIIKPGVPVISGVAAGEAADIVTAESRRLNAPLHMVSEEMPAENLGLREGRQMARLDGRDYTLGLIGGHQVGNAACALTALRQLPEPVTPDAIARGLAATSWVGRFQIVSETPLTVLDGAHNTEAMDRLLQTWREFLAGRGRAGERAHLLFASVSDKDISALARLLLPHVAEVTLARLQNERSAEPAELARHFAGVPVHVVESVAEFHPSASRPVLATGSLFLIGEMLARGADTRNEFRLNERLETPAPPP
jgi:dihydrofolate synthase/folylpolyglutamate synthase